MSVIHGLPSVEPPLTQSVLTIGNFDGVHRAHQQLVAQAGLLAANTGGPVVALTFEPHPLSVLARGTPPPRLSLPSQKARWLSKAGADLVVIAQSTPDLLGLEPEAFVRDVLVARFRPTHIVEGPSFGFGRGRQGDSGLLRRLGPRYGFAVHVVGSVEVEVDAGETILVSSSLIRRLLVEGKVHRAALCLGRPYTIEGPVVPGAQRGRDLGFPTANVAVHEQLLPGDGVYAGRARVGTHTHAAAISVGTRETFANGSRALEVHVLDFTGDLYGQTLGVEFLRPLRPQQKFDSADALVQQLHRDIEAVRTGQHWPQSPGRPPAKEDS